MTGCASGCVTRDHARDCPGDCDGCLPRETAHGQLCQRCWASLSRDVLTAPALVDWLREQVEPGSSGSDGRVSGSRTPPAPLSAVAVAAADDLHAMLASWAFLVAERRGLQGPPLAGSLVRPASKRRIDKADVDVLGYPTRLDYGDPAWPAAVVYEPARVVGVHSSGRGTERVCRWLSRHLEWAAGEDFAADMVAEVTSTTARLLARWPMEARQRPITDMACPGCDRKSLVYFPVGFYRGSVLVQCEHPACGERIDEDKWAWTASVIASARHNRGGEHR